MLVSHHDQGEVKISSTFEHLYINDEAVLFELLTSNVCMVSSTAGYQFNACLCDFLYENQDMIPERCQHITCVFPGTVFRDATYPDGALFFKALSYNARLHKWMSVAYIDGAICAYGSFVY